MKLIRSVLFDRTERELLHAAQVFIEVAYPRASNPLVPAGLGVPDDDPHLKVLRSLAVNANDPVPYARLLLAQETLRALAAAVTAQADPAFWAAQVPGRELSETEQGMSHVLTEERAASLPTINQARTVVDQAVASLSVRDDPTWWRDNARGFDA